MATDLDPRTAGWTNTDMVLVNDDVYTETFAGAIAEDVGFAAYMPRMAAAQADVITDMSGAYPTYISQSHKFYILAGTYDMVGAAKITDNGGVTYWRMGADGTYWASGSGASGWVYGSVSGQVFGTTGWYDAVFGVATGASGDTSMNYGVMFAQLADGV